jgi:hypothetical protein
VLLKIRKYDIVRDVAARGGEVARARICRLQVRLRKSGNSSAPDAMSVRHASHGVNATVFIEFVTRLIAGAKRENFLIVDCGPAHIAKKTRAFVESLKGKLQLFSRRSG